MATRIARTDELEPGESKRFRLTCDAREIECFLLNVAGTYHAYVNRCRHVPMELDWVENQFFSEDGRFLQCATHGAYYLPESGECVAGPPCGRWLVRVPLTIDGDEIRADCPGPLPDDA